MRWPLRIVLVLACSAGLTEVGRALLPDPQLGEGGLLGWLRLALEPPLRSLCAVGALGLALVGRGPRAQAELDPASRTYP